MGGGHSQNAGPDLAIASSYARYFENALTLGLYPTLFFHFSPHTDLVFAQVLQEFEALIFCFLSFHAHRVLAKYHCE